MMKLIKDSGIVETGKQFCVVEVGAGTMLPSLTVAMNFQQSTCIATDHPKLFEVLTTSHELNKTPSNLIPLEFKLGN
jgi:tRNA U34 5-methylaminomethyl-2-thiouridine-forming methyltransferase MnmC